MILKPKIVPKKSQTRFYNFLMYKIIPMVLREFRALDGQDKYFWDKPGFEYWYKYRIKLYWERGHYVKIIICCIISLYQKEIK